MVTVLRVEIVLG